MKKRIVAVLMIGLLLQTTGLSLGETMEMSPPPDLPAGNGPGPEGQPPSGSPEGQTPPDVPEGQGGKPGMAGNGPGGGKPGGGQGQPEAYQAVHTLEEDTQWTGETIASTGKDESAVLVTAGSTSLTDSTIIRQSTDSTGGDVSSFYGVGAALLATGGTLAVQNTSIATDASGGAGAFAYGEGVLHISDSTITTNQDTSGGIHVAGGGTLYASHLTVTTQGESSAAIRSDRGSGQMVVDGGSYTSNGKGSPAVYVTADIAIQEAELTSTGSEALCLEGLNSVRLYHCRLAGDMPDMEQNDNTWTVILYQSMSGDAQVGKGYFEMVEGSLVSGNGGLFYTTNTESEFVLENVTLQASEDFEYLLRCTGNGNQRGWGANGANGADCTFTAIRQEMAGEIIWDRISTLTVFVTEGSQWTGSLVEEETWAGNGGDGFAALTLDGSSRWVVTGDSRLASLNAAGEIVDEEGRAVAVLGTDGQTYMEGSSPYTITVDAYSDQVDLKGAGSASSFGEYTGV